MLFRSLFIAHPVVGSVGIIAAYELVRRSAGSGSSLKFIPSEKKKTSNLNKYNQFPLTVEEIVIKSKLPYSFNLSDPSDNASYHPVQGDIHEASDIDTL